MMESISTQVFLAYLEFKASGPTDGIDFAAWMKLQRERRERARLVDYTCD